jgi:hypothetical protein
MSRSRRFITLHPRQRKFICDAFVCTRCGQHVESLPPVDPPPTVCAICRCLDAMDLDPAEREDLRERLCGARAAL